MASEIPAGDLDQLKVSEDAHFPGENVPVRI